MNIFEALRKHGATLPIFTVVLVGSLLVFPLGAAGQSSSSAVNGVVTDFTGAVVAGAKVTLRNVDTNVERTTVSNGAGDYFFSSVPPARYTLTFCRASFQTETISAFEVAVAQAVTVNASLKVGDVTQSVTVEASGTQVESSTAQLGTVIGEKAVNDLPLDGRNFTQLLHADSRGDAHQHRARTAAPAIPPWLLPALRTTPSPRLTARATGPRCIWWTA